MSKTDPFNVKVHVIELDKDTNLAESINKILAEVFGDSADSVTEPENAVESEEVETGCTYPDCDCHTYADDDKTARDLTEEEMCEAVEALMAKYCETDNVDGSSDEGDPEPTENEKKWLQEIEPVLQEHFKVGLRVVNVEYSVDGVTQYFPFLAYNPKDAKNVLNAIKETGKVHSYWDNIDSLRNFVKISGPVVNPKD